jgi:DNA-binding transcriptional MerR regulator
MDKIGYFSKEVALQLDINASTLRQWCLAIEREGYTLERNNKDQRIFYERDINMLFKIKSQIEKTRNRDNAIKATVSRFLLENNTENTLSVNEEERDKIALSKEELQSLIEQSVERAIEKEREAMFKAFEHKMNDVIESRDRQIVHQLKDSMEKQRLEIAAAQQEREEEEEKKGFWSKLFGK